MISEFKYQCDFCHARFKTETRFMKHHCKEMKREEDFRSLEGQAAQLFYKAWMMHKHRAHTTSPSAFKESKYFNMFIKFVNFVKQTKLPDTDAYIKLMVQQKIEPNNWTSDIAYGRYLEWVTRVLPTDRLIEITVTSMFDYADESHVNVSDVFTVISPNEIIQMLHQRRISPWILLNSRKFSEFFRNNTTPEERVIMESLINPDYWMSRFKSHTDDLKLAKDCVIALDL